MEQNQTIEEQSKNLGKLEKNKVKTEMKLSTVKSELQNQQLRARDEIQQTQRLLNTQSSAITELAHTEKQVHTDIIQTPEPALLMFHQITNLTQFHCSCWIFMLWCLRCWVSTAPAASQTMKF